MITLPVTGVRGNPGRLTTRQAALGIEPMAQLHETGPVTIRRKFSIVQMRTGPEHNGQPAIPREDETACKHRVWVSRSFFDPIWKVVDAVNSGFGGCGYR